MPDALHAGSVIARSPGQIAGEIDDQVVLLSIETGSYFHFNTVGSRIWSLIETPITAAALIDQLVHEFAIDLDTCYGQVVDFLRDLSENGLIRVETCQGDRPSILGP